MQLNIIRTTCKAIKLIKMIPIGNIDYFYKLMRLHDVKISNYLTQQIKVVCACFLLQEVIVR